MTFDQCLDFVLTREGGDRITNDPHDPGGLTKFGIAQKYHPEVDVANLTLDQAKDIYRTEYWKACRCDELPDFLRLAVFDAAVNTSPENAIRFLQRALKVTADGTIGPATLAAAMRASNETLPLLLTERLLFYGSRDGFCLYGRGWVRRCLDLQATALQELIA